MSIKTVPKYPYDLLKVNEGQLSCSALLFDFQLVEGVLANIEWLSCPFLFAKTSLANQIFW